VAQHYLKLVSKALKRALDDAAPSAELVEAVAGVSLAAAGAQLIGSGILFPEDGWPPGDLLS